MAPANVLTLTGLMFVGGAPASTSGGITTSAFAVLVLAMWRYAQGRRRVEVAGRTIPTETILKAVAIVVIALAVVIVVTWLLLLTQPTTFSEALFEAVSAFTTAGYTLGLTPRLDLFGRLLIAATMFWGRLGALTIVVALANPRQAAPVQYPEEQVLIG
jgi:trk system potassium uptake protein TrkH